MINLEIYNYKGTYLHLNGQRNQGVSPLGLARAMIIIGQGREGYKAIIKFSGKLKISSSLTGYTSYTYRWK